MKTKINRRNARQLANRLVLLAGLIVLVIAGPAQTAQAADPTPTPPGPIIPWPQAPALNEPPSVQPAISPAEQPGPLLQPLAADFTYDTYLPLVLRGSGSGSSEVNPQNRAESRNFYLANYAVPDVPPGWTGSFAGCAPGATTAAFRESVLTRINYYRLMAGIPQVTFSETSNRLAQAAAFMMSVNRDLSHFPPPTWQCYSEDGKDGAGSSNLALGAYGPEAIDLYMMDWAGGSSNAALGHRRWILFPWTREMGTGDIPGGSGYPSTNALRVLGVDTWPQRPATREPYVAWPPPGYVPRPIVFAAWSFSYQEADFTNATVAMSSAGGGVPVQILSTFEGYGDNALIWAPSISTGGSADVSYQVSIQNVLIGGQPRSFTYTVTLFTP